jgi:ribosomal protein L37AE/L43A
MIENPWKCEKCGSEKVSQEWSAFLPMNEREPDVPEWNEGLDSFWCEACEDTCEPSRSGTGPWGPQTFRVKE